MNESENLALLHDIASWPKSGHGKQICCVKKYPKDLPLGKFPPMDCFGMVLAHNGAILNAPGTTGVTIIREEAEPLNYASMEAMVADGWVVD